MAGQARLDTTIVNSLSEIPRVVEMVETLGAEHDLSGDVVYDLQLALEEILTNVITHGYGDERVHHISVRLDLGEGVVTAEVVDDGRPFNPMEAPGPDLGADLRDRPAGGLGIHFVRELMDAMEYSRLENRNHIVLRKRTGR